MDAGLRVCNLIEVRRNIAAPSPCSPDLNAIENVYAKLKSDPLKGRSSRKAG
jgi:transposase